MIEKMNNMPICVCCGDVIQLKPGGFINGMCDITNEEVIACYFKSHKIPYEHGASMTRRCIFTAGRQTMVGDEYFVKELRVLDDIYRLEYYHQCHRTKDCSTYMEIPRNLYNRNIFNPNTLKYLFEKLMDALENIDINQHIKIEFDSDDFERYFSCEGDVD